MPAPEVCRELIDAAKLAETVTSVSKWLAGPGQPQRAASFCFAGTDGYGHAKDER